VDGGHSTASQPDTRSGIVPSKKKGILVPQHSKSIKKYDVLAVPKIVRKFLGLKRVSPSGLPPSCVKLLSCKIARATWGRYAAAVKIWKKFSNEKGGVANVSFENSRVEFIGWCASKRELAPSTVRVYLGALKNLYQLRNEWAAGKGELLEKSLLKGLENIRGQTNRKRKARKTIPVSLKILENIKRGLRLQNWAQGSKICVWAACLVAFWGVFRLGELLPKSELKFDKTSDLLWSDVRISKREEGGMLLKVRGCKVRGNPGNSARLFNLKKKEFCPVAALEALKNSQKTRGLFALENPVFRRASGRNLTKPVFLRAVNAVCGNKRDSKLTLGGKSFRSGVPSALQNLPRDFNERHVKSLGRWRGNAYQRYMRNDEPEFRWVFQTVSDLLLTDAFGVQGKNLQ
jgi:hypothetical protein